MEGRGGVPRGFVAFEAETAGFGRVEGYVVRITHLLLAIPWIVVWALKKKRNCGVTLFLFFFQVCVDMIFKSRQAN